MIKLHKYLTTKWNRIDSNFEAGLVREMMTLIFPLNITERFLCKADFILSKKIFHDSIKIYIPGS